MGLHRRDVLKFLSYTAAGLAANLKARRAAANRGCDVIERDVCVIGGGSSGTFTAVKLRDAGKSVAVVERKDRLGGHCETYFDSATGLPIDYGVVVFHDLPLVRDYFSRFGVPLAPLGLGGGSTRYYDYRTGNQVAFTPPSQAELGQALGIYFGYLQQLKATYYDLDSGFDLPTPVPPDLLMSWGDFIKKYSLQAMAMTAFDFGQGLGNILNLPAVYVLKNFSAGVISQIFAGSFLAVPNGNSELYLAATSFLGDDVLFGACIERVERNHKGVTVWVDTPEGRREIRAKKLVVTCPPTLDNLGAFDLDHVESNTFSRFRWSYYWTSLVRITGVPLGVSFPNIAPETPYNLPPLPALYAIAPTRVPGIFDIKFGSPTFLSDDEVRRRIVNDVRRLHDPTDFPTPPRVTEFVTFSGHNPFELRVQPEEIANGFYTTLGSLQGRNHTFYNGAAFHTHDSSLLWQFTVDHVLPKILA
jgi:hypothetical protein